MCVSVVWYFGLYHYRNMIIFGFYVQLVCYAAMYVMPCHLYNIKLNRIGID